MWLCYSLHIFSDSPSSGFQQLKIFEICIVEICFGQIGLHGDTLPEKDNIEKLVYEYDNWECGFHYGTKPLALPTPRKTYQKKLTIRTYLPKQYYN